MTNDDAQFDLHRRTVLGGLSGLGVLSAAGGTAAAAEIRTADLASAVGTVELDPDGGVRYLNRPPEWMTDGVVYQIFTRSWAGRREATTFETLARGDGVARGVDYLENWGSTSSGHADPPGSERGAGAAAVMGPRGPQSVSRAPDRRVTRRRSTSRRSTGRRTTSNRPQRGNRVAVVRL